MQVSDVMVPQVLGLARTCPTVGFYPPRVYSRKESTDGVYQSGVDACATVREAVEMLDGSSDGWSELAGLPAVHSCVLRRPINWLRKLFDLIRQGRLPVAGIFLDESLGIPDHVVEKDRGPAEFPELCSILRRRTRTDQASRSPRSRKV